MSGSPHDARGGRERRLTPRRRTAAQHGIASVRVRPGSEAHLLNVSAGGALIETRHRLMPGTTIELQLATSDRRIAIRGRVARSVVSCLRSGRVLYRGAIVFDRPLSWFVDTEGNAVPAAEDGAHRRRGEDATRHIG